MIDGSKYSTSILVHLVDEVIHLSRVGGVLGLQGRVQPHNQVAQAELIDLANSAEVVYVTTGNTLRPSASVNARGRGPWLSLMG